MNKSFSTFPGFNVPLLVVTRFAILNSLSEATDPIGADKNRRARVASRGNFFLFTAQ